MNQELTLNLELVLNKIPGKHLLLQPDCPVYTLLAISDELLEAFALERENIIGRGLTNIFPDSLDALSTTALLQTLESTLAQNGLEVTQNGEQPALKCTPIQDQEGNLQSILVSLPEQITKANQQAKEAQCIKNTTYSLLLQAPVAVCLLKGEAYTIELMNNKMHQFFGLSTQVEGKPLFEALPCLKDKQLNKLLNQVQETGQPVHTIEQPLSCTQAGDSQVYFHCILQPYSEYNDSSAPSGIFVVAYDVSEQVLARKNVEESQAQLQAIINATPDCIKIVSVDGELQFMNSYGLDMIEGDDSLIGRANVFSIVAPEHRNSWIRNHKRICNGESINWEFDIIGLKGTRRRMETHAVPLQGISGTMHLAVTRDMTERKKAEEALASYNAELIRINNDLDNFIYTASHDLKSPILNIEGLLNLLSDELKEEDISNQDIPHIIELMSSSVERFKKTISSLTDVVKLRQEITGTASHVNLKELVEEVCLNLEPTLKAAGGSIDCQLDGAASLHFSEKNLRSILHNLVSNAIKYRHHERDLKVSVSCTSTPEHHIITVADNGLGIAEKNRKQLFTMFKRFHDHVEGTGIGLYMIKKIVDNAGGQIEVNTIEGEGSTFTVYLKR